MRAHGYVAEPFDVLYSKFHDIETKEGLRHLTSKVASLVPNGCIWGGPPCKTWVFIARSGTYRTLANPGGNILVPRVAQTNLQTRNFISLCVLAVLLGGHYVLENPGSTLIHHFPVVRALYACTSATKVRTYMGQFGADVVKPLDLWSSTPHLVGMKRAKPQGLEGSLVVRKGRRVTGKKKDLTDSAAYTLLFGEAFAEVLEAHFEERPLEMAAGQRVAKRPASADPFRICSKHSRVFVERRGGITIFGRELL